MFNIVFPSIELEFIDLLERVVAQGIENALDNLKIEGQFLKAKYTKNGGGSTTL